MAILWAVNLMVAAFFAVAFFAVAYLSFTSRMAIEEGASPHVIYTARGGIRLVTLLGQGVMAILNLGVVPFLEPDGKKIALANKGLITLVTPFALALGRRHAPTRAPRS